MAATSGLGRNGPWLQNDWLRVETRQDDASISPVALDGAFRPTERALAWIELASEPALHFERAQYDLGPHEDTLGKGRRLTLASALPRRGVRLRREIVVYDALRYWATRVGVTNERAVPLPVRALHAFSTAEGPRGRLRLSSNSSDLRVWRNGWQSWSPTMSFGGAQHDVGSAPPVLSPEPPPSEPGRFASDDVGVLFDPATGRSLLVGCLTARTLLSQVFLDVPARAIDVRCLADDTLIDPGDTLWSEWIAVDLAGAPSEQLERYGDALGRSMWARVPKQTPAGWCSWYYFFTSVSEDDVLRNLRFLERHRADLPVQTVQIDDGYQADIGDWLTVNEKFPHGMAGLAAEIKRAGYTPGLWLAPFLLSESSRTFAEHPEWVVRDAAGSPVIAQHNWRRRNMAIDGSHPDARGWLTELFHEVCDGWGYDYVKIDFLFAAAVAGRRHDPRATRASAYRDALAAVRAGVGDRRFILGCGALMAPSVGFFDGNRIGPDVAPFWRNLTRDERRAPRARPRRTDDQLSAETAIRNTLQRAWMHGRLWANDPDCLLVRTDFTKLTLAETRTLATAIGISAGMLLSSDDLDKVPPDRIEIISKLLPPLPRAAIPLDLLERDMPEQCVLRDDRRFDPLSLLALFNFDDAARDHHVRLPQGRWHAFEWWEQCYLGVLEGELVLAGVEAHGARLVALRPADARPRLVGTAAHLGVGILDISDQAWDARSGRLALGLSPAGLRRQRLFVSTAGHAVRDANVDGQVVDVRLEGEVVLCDVIVEQPRQLALTFENR
ncbi:MAG TPA: glycoside hydrolase family 36 protein [Dehalococcoidia bacterium]|nr:glycoside hydrolase family 36 protein [Dehalococcoidia bacterium]